MRYRWIILVACVFAAPWISAAESGGAPSELRTLDYYAETGETHLVFGANNPFFYTIYRSAPDVLTMEFPGLDASAVAAKVSGVKTGEVRGMSAEVSGAGAPQAKTKLTIQITPGATYSHWMQGTSLYLDLFSEAGASAPDAAGAPSAEASALTAELREESMTEASAETADESAGPDTVRESPAPEPVKGAAAPAKRIKDIRAAGDRVVIVGDGAMEYETFTLSGPDRIVVDVIGVTAAGKTVPGSGSVDRVRVGQFRTEPRRVARVVLDVKSQQIYQVVPEGDTLEVVLGKTAKHAAAAATISAANPSAGTNTATPALKPVPAPRPAEAAAPAPSQPRAVVTMEKSAVAEPKTAAAPVGAAEMARLGGEAEAQWLALDVSHFESAAGSTPPTPAQQFFQGGTIAGETKYTGAPISFDLKDTDIKDVFRFFHEISGWNFVLDKSVSGRINLILKNVPWDQALDIVLKNEGLGKVFEGNVIFIAPNARLTKEQADQRKLKDERELAEDPITVMKRLSYAKASDVITLVKAGKLMSKKGQVFQDKRTNTIYIQDVPQRVEVIDRLIQSLDISTPQVEIEARIVETTKDYAKGMGIQWGTQVRFDQAHGTTTDLQFPHRVGVDYNVILPAGGAFSVLGMSMGNVLDSFTLDVQLTALERTGKGKVLSSPRVVTLNNEKASIESGVQVPYVTTTDLQVNVQFMAATLKLDVTPQITAEETVILDIKVDKSEPGAPVTAQGVNIPSIITRKAQTQVLVRDGGTVVIGGVFQVSDTNSLQFVPKLGKIPGLGWLFRSKSHTTRNDELLIFITPRIQRLQV